jgi:predicted phosphodiesterase
MQQADYQLTSLMYKAMENNCKAVVFGHTHCSLVEEANGIHFVNPASLTQPRHGSSGSYAIIRTTETSFDASVVYYSTIMGSSKKTTQAGYIRSLLNYSDRF